MILLEFVLVMLNVYKEIAFLQENKFSVVIETRVEEIIQTARIECYMIVLK